MNDLARSFSASLAMAREDAGSVAGIEGKSGVNTDLATLAYRAGRFDGYLVSIGESLQARGEICLPACFCHVREQFDPQLESWLADPALDRSQSAQHWLADRLRAAYPCPSR